MGWPSLRGPELTASEQCLSLPVPQDGKGNDCFIIHLVLHIDLLFKLCMAPEESLLGWGQGGAGWGAEMSRGQGEAHWSLGRNASS